MRGRTRGRMPLGRKINVRDKNMTQAGIELATYSLGGCHSIQLSYWIKKYIAGKSRPASHHAGRRRAFPQEPARMAQDYGAA